MNTEILKRPDDAISSTLIGNSKDPDCNVGAATVSYTHLDVYKRQVKWSVCSHYRAASSLFYRYLETF